MLIDRKIKDKEYGFTAASLPRFRKGNEAGVLVCHGFGGTPDNMKCLIDEAEALGFTVCAPLLSGHGTTLGDMESRCLEDWRSDVSAAYDKLKSAGCERMLLCGLSMGALLMLDLAAKRAGEGSIRGVMAICPPVRMRGYLRAMGALAPLMPYIDTGETFEDKRTEIYGGTAPRKLRDLERLGKLVLSEAESVKAPVLLVEAEKDDRVLPSSFARLRERLPACEYAFIEAAPHGVTYSDQAGEVTRLFRQFAERYGK